MIKLSAPLNVTFDVVAECEQNCFFCSQKSSGHAGKEYIENTLNTEEILQVIDRLGDAGIMEIMVTGGEPLLRDDLPLVIKKCKDYNINTEVVTNGLPATKEMSERLYDAGLEWLQVSLQGPEDLHDEIVGLHGAYRRTLRGMKNLKEAGLSIVLSSVVTRRNHGRLPELLEDIGKEALITSYRTLRLMPYSKAVILETVSPSDVKELNQKIVEIAGRHGFEVLDLYAGLEKCAKPAAYAQTMCRAGKTQFGILADGTVTPCMSLKGRNFAIGNILIDSIETLWNHPTMDVFRELTPDKYDGACGQCQNKWGCYSCRAVSYNLTGTLYGDDIGCFDLLKETGIAIG